MEDIEEYSPLYPNDKTIPFPLGLGIEPRGRGLLLLSLAWSWRIGVVLKAIGNVCGGERCEYSCTFIH